MMEDKQFDDRKEKSTWYAAVRTITDKIKEPIKLFTL